VTEVTEVYVTEGPSAPIAMGWIMIIGGAVLAAVSFFYNVGVSTGAGGMYGLPEQVANTDKMAVRSMLLACGLAAFVSGWVSLLGGMILEQIKRR